jgi:hypothetical protein
MVPGGGWSERGAERERLQGELLSAVKQCQIRFGGRKELATDLDPKVVLLCNLLEQALSHGLKPRLPDKKNSAIRLIDSSTTP